jgi:hypothetical protein
MKILMKKSVLSSEGWRWEEKVYDVDNKVASDYIKKGIGVEFVEKVKEEKKTKRNKGKQSGKKKNHQKS